MSHKNMSTEDNAAEDVAHCHSNDEQLFTSSSTTLARQIIEDNKVRSPLMRLPTEIRAIILRMLVGDKLIHVDARRDPVRDDSDGQYWTLVRKYSDNPWSRKDDSRRYPRGYPWGTQFEILNTSHQLHQEAFFIFWHTCQFSFWEKVAAVEFVKRLSEAQKATLSRLVFTSDVEHPYSWYCTNGQDPWEFCYMKILEEMPVGHVYDIVLHLKIREHPLCDTTVAKREASAIKRFESFKPLCLLALKEAKVILSFLRDHPLTDIEIPVKDLACLEDTLSKRLLDPTVTRADLVDALTKKINRLERAKVSAQASADHSLYQAEESQSLADRYRAAAKEGHVRANVHRAAIEGLEAILQKDVMKIFERLAMPEERGE